MAKSILDATKTQIIEEYKFGTSLVKLTKKYNLHMRTVSKIVKNSGIMMRNHSQASREFHHDEYIFDEIDTHEKAYWLGFLAGDAAVIRNTLVLELSTRDLEHLKKFNEFLKSNYNIKFYSREVKFNHKNKSPYTSHIESCKLCISSPRIIKSIEKFGITERKTFKEIIPDIDEKFLNSFILGFVDADGSWSPNITHCTGHRYINFSLIGNHNILNHIQSIFDEKCNVKKNKIILNKESTKMGYLRYGGNKCTKSIAEFLYKDSPIFLERKKNIIINHFNSVDKYKNKINI